MGIHYNIITSVAPDPLCVGEGPDAHKVHDDLRLPDVVFANVLMRCLRVAYDKS